KAEGEDLSGLHALHVCLCKLDQYKIVKPEELVPVLLDSFPRKSQMQLNHKRQRDLCSPTSLSTAINFLQKRMISPTDFAECVLDQEFDIYGNWALNIAECYHQTQSPCRVERLGCFGDLHAHLLKGRPVVVSIKGPIPGGALEYSS